MGLVAGLFDAWADARQSLVALRQEGFRAADLSVVGRYHRSSPEDGLSELTGLVVGLETLTVPEFGPALTAGPLSAALDCGLLGALVEHGFRVAEIPDYLEGMRRGGILLTVNASSARDTEARILLRQNGLRDLSEHRRGWEIDPNSHHESTHSAQLPPVTVLTALGSPVPSPPGPLRDAIRSSAAGTAA
jgi:hypothetical protein